MNVFHVTHIVTPPAPATFSYDNCPDWVVDTGAASSFTHDFSKFIEYTALNEGERSAIGGGGHIMPALGVGTVAETLSIRCTDGVYRTQNVKFFNVLYVPDLHLNLLSLTEINKDGWAADFPDGYPRLYCPASGIYIPLQPVNELFHLQPLEFSPSAPVLDTQCLTGALVNTKEQMAIVPAHASAAAQWKRGEPAL